MGKRKSLNIYLKGLGEDGHIGIVADCDEAERILFYIKSRMDFVVHCENEREYHFFLSGASSAIFVDVENVDPGYRSIVYKVSPMT